MAIRFTCPCGNALSAPDHLAGRRGKCPKCGQVLNVPGQGIPSPDIVLPTYTAYTSYEGKHGGTVELKGKVQHRNQSFIAPILAKARWDVTVDDVRLVMSAAYLTDRSGRQHSLYPDYEINGICDRWRQTLRRFEIYQRESTEEIVWGLTVGFRCDGVLDTRCCRFCRSNDGTFLTKEQVLDRSNVPPYHLGCRCDFTQLMDGHEKPRKRFRPASMPHWTLVTM